MFNTHMMLTRYHAIFNCFANSNSFNDPSNMASHAHFTGGLGEAEALRS